MKKYSRLQHLWQRLFLLLVNISNKLSTIIDYIDNLSRMEFQVRYLALFLLFSLLDGFGWFWMGSLHKNIQLMVEFLKGPFLVLYFSYYTLMRPRVVDPSFIVIFYVKILMQYAVIIWLFYKFSYIFLVSILVWKFQISCILQLYFMPMLIVGKGCKYM